MATMVRVIREFLKIPETTFSTQEILDVCGVLMVNAHEVSRISLGFIKSKLKINVRNGAKHNYYYDF